MDKKDFIKLTERNTEENLYLKRDDVLIITPLTSQSLHRDDYNFEQKKEKYDNKIIFSGILTQNGIVHVKKTPDEVMKVLFE